MLITSAIFHLKQRENHFALNHVLGLHQNKMLPFKCCGKLSLETHIFEILLYNFPICFPLKNS